MFGHLEMAKLLINYGADLDAKNNGGKTPIEMGYRNNKEIKQAIREESQRRMDDVDKKTTEQA